MGVEQSKLKMLKKVALTSQTRYHTITDNLLKDLPVDVTLGQYTDNQVLWREVEVQLTSKLDSRQCLIWSPPGFLVGYSKGILLKMQSGPCVQCSVNI